MPAATAPANLRLITAILPADSEAVGRIREALAADAPQLLIHHGARGALPGCPVDGSGVPIWQEIIVLEALVPESRAEEIFRQTCAAGVLDNADDGAEGAVELSGGGLLLMARSRQPSLAPMA